ncbi:choice-of-anchor A family protein [Catenovulum sp. SX2]|uniref:choice-of-anchor A family protein n=1 Tax=Catenovulum sp. SX2 TaxID=3398614 RepID=UPI003F8728D8
MKWTTAISVVLLTALHTYSVSASTVDTYNLILKNDLSTSSDIEGKIFIGGDINMPGRSLDVGSKLATDPKVDAVTVVGDISANDVKAENGHNIVYGGNIGSTNLINNGSGGTSTQQNQAALQSEFDALYDKVIAQSQYYQSLAANSTFDTSDFNQKKFVSGASATDELSVYNISSSDILSGGFDFSSTPTIPVVINVAGTGSLNISSKAQGNFTKELASMVLWNFYEATELTFSGDGWNGSILAPYADISGSTGSIDGGVAALSYSGSVEIHNKLFAYTPPEPAQEVPEPPMITLLLIALGLLMARKRLQKA